MDLRTFSQHAMGYFLFPFVVIWFWFTRWVIHNKLVFLLHPMGKRPNVFSYPFIFLYYVFKLTQKSWRHCYAEYGIPKYVNLSKKHYSDNGWGKTVVTPQEIQSKYNELFPRISFYLDNASFVLSCKDGDSILDAGAGYGENLKELAERFPSSKIHAFDVSPNAIGFIKKCSYGDKVTYEEGSFLNDAYIDAYATDSYDWVICSHALSFILGQNISETEYLRKKIISKLFKISRKGLVILTRFPSKDTKFVIEQNTRAMLDTNEAHYFNGLNGEVYMTAENDSECCYIVLKK